MRWLISIIKNPRLLVEDFKVGGWLSGLSYNLFYVGCLLKMAIYSRGSCQIPSMVRVRDFILVMYTPFRKLAGSSYVP